VPDNQRWIWLGLIYGCALFAFAAVDSGFGHGTYLPFGIYGAPISIVPFVGMLAPPFWWGMLGYLIASRQRGGAATMLAIHTIAVAVVLWLGTPMECGTERWTYFSKAERAMPIWLWSGMAMYVIGQLVAWTVTIRLNAMK
jgi:hypothetical protein